MGYSGVEQKIKTSAYEWLQNKLFKKRKNKGSERDVQIEREREMDERRRVRNEMSMDTQTLIFQVAGWLSQLIVVGPISIYRLIPLEELAW